MSGPTKKQKLGHVRVPQISLRSIYPSPENDQIYRPIEWNDPDILSLIASIREFGVQEPIVITKDNYIVSGHRRYMAAKRAGRKRVPFRRLAVTRKGHPDYLSLLREFNRQRVKTRDEQLREEIVSADPEEAHRALREYREKAAEIDVETIQIRGKKTRHEISAAKQPFLNAVLAVVERLRRYWPISDRQIHYQLLNDPPLIHAKKPESVYCNDAKSYKALSDLLTRARYEGHIDFDVIHDPTRPETVWDVHDDVGTYYRRQINGMLKGYYRNLLQSQPNHIEIVGEKNTIQGILSPVAARYGVPITIGRGFCSTPPKYKISERYRESGKAKLIILGVSDFDPDGEEIVHSLARSLKYDFHIHNIEAIKVALTAEQVHRLALPEGMLKAKPSSPNYHRFRSRYGDSVYELEAIPPDELQQMLRSAIESVLDMQAFKAEIEAEKKDAAHLDAVRRRIISTLQTAGEITT